MTPEEQAALQRIDAKVDRISVYVRALVTERNLLRKVLGEAYSALKSLDLAEDALGMEIDPGNGEILWSYRNELFNNIEIALGIDEEE